MRIQSRTTFLAAHIGKRQDPYQLGLTHLAERMFEESTGRLALRILPQARGGDEAGCFVARTQDSTGLASSDNHTRGNGSGLVILRCSGAAYAGCSGILCDPEVRAIELATNRCPHQPIPSIQVALVAAST